VRVGTKGRDKHKIEEEERKKETQKDQKSETNENKLLNRKREIERK
jgi:hypothetical protein